MIKLGENVKEKKAVIRSKSSTCSIPSFRQETLKSFLTVKVSSIKYGIVLCSLPSKSLLLTHLTLTSETQHPALHESMP